MVLISCFPVKMGMADAIVDLVSSGTTLRENNLKEIEDGVVVQSQVNLISLTPRCFFLIGKIIPFLRYKILCRPLL